MPKILKSSMYAVFLFSCFSLTSFAQEIDNSSAPLSRNPSEAIESKSAKKVEIPDLFAKASLEPRSGFGTTGTVEFKRTDNTVVVFVNVTNASPGKHGIHIHEKGDCSAADAMSAGDHYNPAGTPHASPFIAQRHFGDLGNIKVNKNGAGAMTLTIPRRSNDTANEWQNIIGKAVVLHENEDDFKTQPSGNSGRRIACGVIREASNVMAH